MITNRLDLDHEQSSQDLYMKAQRRRYNHPATTWTHSLWWKYSCFIPEAGMMKKKASRMISPPAGCREELQIPPILGRWWRRLEKVSWSFDRVSRVSASGASYRRRGEPGGPLGRLHPPGAGWAHPRSQGVWPGEPS